MTGLLPRGSAATKAKNIVLAEDDVELAAIFEASLELDGHRVFTVRSGVRAVDEIRRILMDGEEGGHVDLLVLDVCMPMMSGVVVLEVLHQIGLSIPALLMSAFPTDELVQMAKRLHAPLLAKPFRLQSFRNAVRTVLDS